MDVDRGSLTESKGNRVTHGSCELEIPNTLCMKLKCGTVTDILFIIDIDNATKPKANRELNFINGFNTI